MAKFEAQGNQNEMFKVGEKVDTHLMIVWQKGLEDMLEAGASMKEILTGVDECLYDNSYMVEAQKIAEAAAEHPDVSEEEKAEFEQQNKLLKERLETYSDGHDD